MADIYMIYFYYMNYEENNESSKLNLRRSVGLTDFDLATKIRPDWFLVQKEYFHLMVTSAKKTIFAIT